MNEEELNTVEPETTKTELIVEQSDLDLILALPVFGQLENVDENTTEMLSELQKLNEFLIPTEEEKEEMELQALEQSESTEEPVEIELMQTEEPVEPEVDYDPLILEQLEILNTHMEENKELLNEGNIIGSETAWLMVVTIVCAIGVKVLVDQITKW